MDDRRSEYKRKAERQTKKFMKAARAFLATKLTGSSDGQIPDEFELNLILLESYYKQFIMLDLEINDLESLVIEGRYGPLVNPICNARDKACVRLESLIKQLGLSLKSGKQIGSIEISKKESPLDKFFAENNSKIEKR